MKWRRIAALLIVLSCLILASCSDSKGYETGSGTASRNEVVTSDGLTDGGIINDASDWGPVVGIN